MYAKTIYMLGKTCIFLTKLISANFSRPKSEAGRLAGRLKLATLAPGRCKEGGQMSMSYFCPPLVQCPRPCAGTVRQRDYSHRQDKQSTHCGQPGKDCTQTTCY